jgi:AraC-like DNA-binding protein
MTMNDRFRLSRNYFLRLEERGLAPHAVFRQAGISEEALGRERVVLSTEQLFALHRAIAELSNDPAIGLKLGTEDRIERFDPIGIAALCAGSLHEAVERVARYKQLTCPETIHVSTRSDELTIRYEWSLARDCEPPLLLDQCFAWSICVARRGTGRAVTPKRVEFARPPSHRDMYRAHFGCPVQFKARRNAIVFRMEDAARPFVTHNPDLLGIVASNLEEELTQRLAERTVRDQVKDALKRLLAGQAPRLEDVARQIGIGTRTLQRRLTQEDASFQSLVNDARRELARHYLLQHSLELDETAYLLGYEDANSFFRAFHRWEGTSPGEWRSAQMKLMSAGSGS